MFLHTVLCSLYGNGRLSGEISAEAYPAGASPAAGPKGLAETMPGAGPGRFRSDRLCHLCRLQLPHDAWHCLSAASKHRGSMEGATGEAQQIGRYRRGSSFLYALLVCTILLCKDSTCRTYKPSGVISAFVVADSAMMRSLPRHVPETFASA